LERPPSRRSRAAGLRRSQITGPMKSSGKRCEAAGTAGRLGARICRSGSTCSTSSMATWLGLPTPPNQQVDIYLRYSSRAKRSGLEVPPEYFAIVIEVRDGKIARAQEYATHAEALEAVGLRE
jgi:hypothetical protein